MPCTPADLETVFAANRFHRSRQRRYRLRLARRQWFALPHAVGAT